MLLYLVSAIPLGALGFAVLVTGWTLSLVLSITPLVVPVLAGFRAAVGWIARAEAALANALLGTSIEPSTTSPGPSGFWRRAGNVLQDDAFWRQQAFLLQRFVLGWTLAVAELTLVAAGAGAVALPIYYRWSDTEIGSWHVDTLGRSLLFVPAGIAALALALLLVRPLAALSRSLAAALLGGEGANEPSRPPAVVHAAPAFARAPRGDLRHPEPGARRHLGGHHAGLLLAHVDADPLSACSSACTPGPSSSTSGRISSGGSG